MSPKIKKAMISSQGHVLMVNKNAGVLLTTLNLRKRRFKTKTIQQVPVHDAGKVMKSSWFIKKIRAII